MEDTVFHSMDHVLLKYWTCPFCHRELPYKVEISQHIGNKRFHLLPGAVEDCCPYWVTEISNLFDTIKSIFNL